MSRERYTVYTRLFSMHPPNAQTHHRVPVLTIAALSLVSTPKCLIFIKSISAASVVEVLRRTRPPAKSILIDHHWLSQMRIDPVQTHAQGPLKTHSLHNSLTNEVLPPLWRFIKEIIFDLFTIVQLRFGPKPIKVCVCYRVQMRYEMCHSLILVLPSQVSDEVLQDGHGLGLFACFIFPSLYLCKRALIC